MICRPVRAREANISEVGSTLALYVDLETHVSKRSVLVRPLAPPNPAEKRSHREANELESQLQQGVLLEAIAWRR